VADAGVVEALARSAREVHGWVFVGFNWPVLASRVARRLGRDHVELFEAGVALGSAPTLLPSSTTDFASCAGHQRWQGTTLDTLAMIRRVDSVLLDASTVDLSGCINTFGEGPVVRPDFRSAGGGGSADVAVRANRLVLISLGRLERIQERVSHVTAAPNPRAEVLLVCRGGVLSLGASPRLTEISDSREGADLLRHLESMHVPTSGAAPATTVPKDEQSAVIGVLQEAATRGYQSAVRALSDQRGAQ